MITPRRADDRGHAEHGWLLSHHTFSFADYRDDRFMGFRSLRVINEDVVQPGLGFGTHPHRDMEILTWVLEGELAHRDSMGTGATIRPGEIQRMTAGTGVAHSEMNPSPDRPVHLLQIWIVPERRGLAPGYEQRHFPEDARRGRLATLAARDGRDGAVTIHQDATLSTALLAPGESVAHELRPGRGAWLQVARGSVTVHAEPASGSEPLSTARPSSGTETVMLHAGDGAAIESVARLRITAVAPSAVAPSAGAPSAGAPSAGAPPSGATKVEPAGVGKTSRPSDFAEILLFDLS
jgi:quercetin 2,3-dioxygenase